MLGPFGNKPQVAGFGFIELSLSFTDSSILSYLTLLTVILLNTGFRMGLLFLDFFLVPRERFFGEFWGDLREGGVEVSIPRPRIEPPP